VTLLELKGSVRGRKDSEALKLERRQQGLVSPGLKVGESLGEARLPDYLLSGAAPVPAKGEDRGAGARAKKEDST